MFPRLSNRLTPAVLRRRNLDAIYLLAAGYWGIRAIATYSEDIIVWPPSGGRFGLFDWWPMYVYFSIIAVVGLTLRWGFVIPCILLGVILGDSLDPFGKGSTYEHRIWETVHCMFIGVFIGFVIGVILEKFYPDNQRPAAGGVAGSER